MGISFDGSFHHFWLAVVFVKMPSRQHKRRELNDERNTFKIETVDELESSRFGTMPLILNISGCLLVTLIEDWGGGGGGGCIIISARSSIIELRHT